jgi:hypothetical protein
LSTVGLAQTAAAYNPQSGGQNSTFMYKHTSYLDSDVRNDTSVSTGAVDWQTLPGSFTTDKAKQNNSGIVTQYPFKISSSLQIAGTNTQYFSLNVEDPDLTVWYTLSGGRTGTHSSLMAADPQDGQDNYFLYSYGSVFFCGAGYSKLTGINKDNNDERMLIINVIVNSARKSVRGTNVDVFDYGKVSNTEVTKTDEGTYEMSVTDTTDTPKFSFMTTTDTTSNVSVSRVQIYYDLDYLTHTGNKDEIGAAESHIVIYDSNNDTKSPKTDISAGVLVNVDGTLSFKDGTTEAILLQLKDSYFKPYGGEYTYIVIAVTDSNGDVVYRRIKIKTSPYLYDLT